MNQPFSSQNFWQSQSNQHYNQDYSQPSDMRSGDSLRDLYYQSPYLRRFSSTRFNAFSNEKESANKENISPLSNGNFNQNNQTGGMNCIYGGHTNGMLNSAAPSVSTTSGGGNTTQNTPIQNNISTVFSNNSLNRERNRESPNFQLSLMNSASPHQDLIVVKDQDQPSNFFQEQNQDASNSGSTIYSQFNPFDPETHQSSSTQQFFLHRESHYFSNNRDDEIINSNLNNDQVFKKNNSFHHSKSFSNQQYDYISISEEINYENFKEFQENEERKEEQKQETPYKNMNQSMYSNFANIQGISSTPQYIQNNKLQTFLSPFERNKNSRVGQTINYNNGNTTISMIPQNTQILIQNTGGANPYFPPQLQQVNLSAQQQAQINDFDVRFQTIEEVQSDMGEIDSNSENTHSQRTSETSTSMQEQQQQQQQLFASNYTNSNNLHHSAAQSSNLRLRTRPVLQERSILESTPNSRSSIIKRINFSHSKSNTQSKRNGKNTQTLLSKAVQSLR